MRVIKRIFLVRFFNLRIDKEGVKSHPVYNEQFDIQTPADRPVSGNLGRHGTAAGTSADADDTAHVGAGTPPA